MLWDTEIILVFITSTKSKQLISFQQYFKEFWRKHFNLQHLSFLHETLEHDYIIKLFPFTWLSVLTPFAIKKIGFCPALTVFTNFTKSVSFARITLRWTLWRFHIFFLEKTSVFLFVPWLVLSLREVTFLTVVYGHQNQQVGYQTLCMAHRHYNQHDYWYKSIKMSTSKPIKTEVWKKRWHIHIKYTSRCPLSLLKQWTV